MWLIGIILAKGNLLTHWDNVSSIEKYSDGATYFERFELKIIQISLTAANATAVFFHVGCRNKCGL